jgi:hypothetical protein
VTVENRSGAVHLEEPDGGLALIAPNLEAFLDALVPLPL